MSNINVNNLTPLLGSGSSVSVSGSLVVKNDVTIGGHLYIGDQDNDNVKFSAEVSSSVIPNNHNVWDLGSLTKQWSSIYVDCGSRTCSSARGLAHGDDLNLLPELGPYGNGFGGHGWRMMLA